MPDFAANVVPIRIEDEMKNAYMDYSMSVIIGRALPDVRDGLKPVHRRILYAMHQEGLQANKKYSKCAGVVGEVLKKYHPHGDSAVYDALARMAQPWNLRYLLVDGQGNFGSVDGDPPAAYRYTECRMTRLAEQLLLDIDKDTVGWSPNFDGTVEEPDVLPAAYPNLLVNGADGIAVGMATKIPPHNLGEVIDALIALIDDPDIDLAGLMKHIPGPDFPTGGTIYGRKGVHEAYATGRGRVVVRGRAQFEDLPNGRRAIVIDEIPYQVNKSRLVEQIAQLVKDKKIQGIRDLRDESDRRGMRVVVELRKDAFEEVVLNTLYKHTALQSTFGVILLAIVNDRPKVLTLHQMLDHYRAHRREVVLRRTRYLLRKARERAHILEGYRIALDHIDEVIALIRASRTPQEARRGLVERFGLSMAQAIAILEMRLQRLTGLERDKIEEEYSTLLRTIEELEGILGSEERLMQVVKDELLEVRARFADARRTRIVDAKGELSIHDLVPAEDHVVTLSRLGYIKRCSPDEWRTQRRGGHGKKGMQTRDEDFVTSIFVANTHSVLMVFTDTGKVYPLNVYEVPEMKPANKGRPIVNLVPVDPDERIAAVVSVRAEELEQEGTDLVFASRLGLVKRTPLSAFKNIRQGGLIATGVAEGDALVSVQKLHADEDVDVMIFTANGQCIRFPRDGSKGAPTFGRTARGNKGIALEEGDHVVDMLLVPAGKDEDEPASIEVEDEPEITLLTVSSLGYGKRTPIDAYPLQGRNGKGVISHATGDGIGEVVRARPVRTDDQLMLVTDTGRVIRIPAASVRLVKSRNSKGVRLMRLREGEHLVDIALIVDDGDDQDTTGEE